MVGVPLTQNNKNQKEIDVKNSDVVMKSIIKETVNKCVIQLINNYDNNNNKKWGRELFYPNFYIYDSNGNYSINNDEKQKYHNIYEYIETPEMIDCSLESIKKTLMSRGSQHSMKMGV